MTEKKVKFDFGSCGICLEPPVENSTPPCGHVFCFLCLLSWCEVNWSCPYCRVQFDRVFHNFSGGNFDVYFNPQATPPIVQPPNFPVVEPLEALLQNRAAVEEPRRQRRRHEQRDRRRESRDSALWKTIWRFVLLKNLIHSKNSCLICSWILLKFLTYFYFRLFLIPTFLKVLLRTAKILGKEMATPKKLSIYYQVPCVYVLICRMNLSTICFEI
jgi:hypothetical protein